MALPLIRRWHRIFGIVLVDLLRRTSWLVELEKDMAQKSQLADVVIWSPTPVPSSDASVPTDGSALADLPDGLDGLRSHNILTFKSQHETLNKYAIDELIGHYVNYRKLISPRNGPLVPEDAFRLLAVSVRFPRKLAGEITLVPAGPAGVFDIKEKTRHIRIIVLSRIESHPRNAVWQLFSGRADLVAQALETYRSRSDAVGSLLYRLLSTHFIEGRDMAYSMEQFLRETREYALKCMKPEELRAFLENLPAEERQSVIHGLGPEERLHGLGPEERLRGLGPEERLRGLGPEERLHGLDEKDLERLRRLLNRRN